MTSLRLYRRILLLILALASVSLIVLMQLDSSRQKIIVIQETVTYNNTTNRSVAVRVVNSMELLQLPDDVKELLMSSGGGVVTPRTLTAAVRTSPVYDSSSVTSLHRRNSTGRKTLYPVTLYAPYVMENPTLCSSVRNLSVLAIVHTAPGHFERREFIRRTWTNNDHFANLGTVRVLFLLGRTKDAKIQHEMEDEFKRHGDLLQGDFVDAYRNLSHKGVMAYKWISERCRNAKLIVKVDDDVCINTYDLLTVYMPQLQNETKRIFCNRILPGTMPIIRKNSSKWYVEEQLFKGRDFYPRYCSGFTVIFTNDFMPALHRAAGVTPFFWVDDVYLYGMVPGKVKGVTYQNFPRGIVNLNGQLVIKCYNNASMTCNFLIAGAASRKEKETVWDLMTKHYQAKEMAKVQAKNTTPHTAAASTEQKKPAANGSAIAKTATDKHENPVVKNATKLDARAKVKDKAVENKAPKTAPEIGTVVNVKKDTGVEKLASKNSTEHGTG